MVFNHARGGRAPAGPRAALLGGLVLLGLAAPLAARAADLVAAAAEDGRFKTFVQALKASDVADVLGERGPFTVLAPTDKAFEKLPEALLDNLMLPANGAALDRVLKLHVVRGSAHAADDLPVNLETIGGERLAVTFTDGALTVRQAAPEDAGEPSSTIESREGNEARVAFGDVEADNGVIHGLDTVLLPADLGRLETADEVAAKAEDGGAGAAENGESEGQGPAAKTEPPPPPEPAADVSVTTYPAGDEGEGGGAAPELTPVPDANVTVTTISPADAETTAEGGTTADQAGTATPEDDQTSPPEPAEAAGTPVPDANVTVTTVPPDATTPPDDAGSDNDRTAPEANRAPTSEPSGAAATPPPPEEDVTVATVPPAPAVEDAADEAAENPTTGASVDLTSPLVPVSELIGRTVRAEDGEDLGKVEDVLISLQTARVERFVLEVDRSLFNLSGRSVNVGVDEVRVDPVDGAVVVDRAVVEE